MKSTSLGLVWESFVDFSTASVTIMRGPSKLGSLMTHRFFGWALQSGFIQIMLRTGQGDLSCYCLFSSLLSKCLFRTVPRLPSLVYSIYLHLISFVDLLFCALPLHLTLDHCVLYLFSKSSLKASMMMKRIVCRISKYSQANRSPQGVVSCIVFN